MACDAQTLITAAYAAGYAALSERSLMECIVASACAGGGGAQQVSYADGLTQALVPAPNNADLPAIAYPANGIGPWYSWNTTTHAWQ